MWRNQSQDHGGTYLFPSSFSCIAFAVAISLIADWTRQVKQAFQNIQLMQNAAAMRVVVVVVVECRVGRQPCVGIRNDRPRCFEFTITFARSDYKCDMKKWVHEKLNSTLELGLTNIEGNVTLEFGSASSN